jgi:competence ComEA-like helix-hairpin-helix protein
MQSSKILTNIRTTLGVTKSEASFVVLLILGLLLGLVYKNFYSSNSSLIPAISQSSVYALLDSLADTESSTFIGTDYYGNSIEDLALADTIVEKQPVMYFASSRPSKSAERIQSPININTASRVQLMQLPGIGEKTADKIIDYRESNPFYSIEDIKKIKGIGDKKFEAIQNLIIVE